MNSNKWWGSTRSGVILAVVLALLVTVRLLIPVLILSQLNRELAEISPTYSIHIERLHLSFIRMFYRLERIEGHLKKNGKNFLSVDGVDVSVAWSELVRGRILTDIEVNHARLIGTMDLFTQSKAPEAHPKDDAKNVSDKLFPLSISSIELRNSELQFGEFIHQPNLAIWTIANLEGTVANLTPTTGLPFTFFNLRGSVLESSSFKATGQLKRLEEPMAWVAQAELRNFDLVKANPIVFAALPLTFRSGTLNAFAEAKSQGGHLQGYVKPFFKSIHVVGDNKDFKTITHFAVEIAVALGNAILRRSKDNTVATKVEFYTENGKLKVRKDKAIARAIDHGFGQPLSESLDNTEKLK